MGLCCVIAGEYAMYIGGKLVSHPDVITMHVAYDRDTCSPDVSFLLQFQKTLAFSLGSLEYSNWPSLTIPTKTIYVIRYGQKTANLKFFGVESIIPCGPRSNIDFIQYVWSHFYYYCGNYAVCVLPSYTSNGKIVYVRHYKAEIGVRALGFVKTVYALVRALECIIILDVKDQEIALTPYVTSNHFR